MKPILATLICFCGIAGLFYLDRERSVRSSKALWLPVIYLWLVCSRSVSEWLGVSSGESVNAQIEGSPIDAVFFSLLLAFAIAILYRRRRKVRILLAANWPILLYFTYCLISASWSYYPDISAKRWIRSTSDLVMMLVVVTDPDPTAAIKRLLSRAGFVLLPLSLLFIKYTDLGRGYTPDGLTVNTGITTNKNVFGVVLLVISIGTFWQLLRLWRTKKSRERKNRLIAQTTLLLFCLVLLRMADSATSLACFALGGGLMFATTLRTFRRRPARVGLLCAAVLIAAGFAFAFSVNTVASALGRNSNLSGRTDIWAALIPTVPNALFGAGFEGYWISPNAKLLWNALSRAGWWHPEILVTEAHNGYIELYLNLGWVGIGIVVLILVSGLARGLAALKRNQSLAGLALAYITVSFIYSATEAGFRSPNPIWIFLLLSILTSTGITSGLITESVVQEGKRLGVPHPQTVQTNLA